MASAPAACNWRAPDAYAWLQGAGRPAFAWEWLRRDPNYRLHWRSDFARFGLVDGADPLMDARVARAMWSRVVNRAVLLCVTGGEGVPFDVAAFGELAHCVARDGVEHWLLSDGLRSVRVDLSGGSLLDGPVPLRIMIDGLGCEASVLAVRRLMIVAATGRFGASLFARETRAARWILVLRVVDALAAGATQRDICECLFEVSAPRWRVVAPSFRLRVQRLVAEARRTLAAGPVGWF